MANVRVIVEDDNGRIVADYPLNNGELAEVLEDALDLRRYYHELTGIELEPNIQPK